MAGQLGPLLRSCGRKTVLGCRFVVTEQIEIDLERFESANLPVCVAGSRLLNGAKDDCLYLIVATNRHWIQMSCL